MEKRSRTLRSHPTAMRVGLINYPIYNREIVSRGVYFCAIFLFINGGVGYRNQRYANQRRHSFKGN